MNNKKQKHIINNMLNSPDLLGRCIDIIKPSYFDPEYIPHVKFLGDYHIKYNSNPSPELMNSEVDSDEEYEKYSIPTDEIDYTAEEVETFCRQSAMQDAITGSISLIQENDFDEVYKKVSDALNVGLKRDMGLNIYDSPEERLNKLLEVLEYTPTGIKTLDALMGGGTLETQFSIVSANSGGGKSVFLSNVGNNYSLQGLDVVYISLELPPEMIFLRQAYIMTHFSHRVWKSKIPEIASKMTEFKNLGVGDFRILRLPIGSNANAIRAYLKQYEIEIGKTPEVLIVDYLDLMSPISGTKNKNISEQDKEKSEEIYELLHMYNMHGWSASQQNRDALKMDSPNQSAIAGGLSKVNICDNWISVFMDGDMRLSGDMMIHMLKTRYADGMHKSSLLSFDDGSLKISDHETPDKTEDLIRTIENRKKKNKESKEKELVESMVESGHIDLPGASEDNSTVTKRLDSLKSQLVDFSDEHNPPVHENQELLELLNFTNHTQLKEDT